MAHPDALANLKQGREAWEKYRKEFKGDKIDLRESDLSNLDLSGFDLSNIDFRHNNGIPATSFQNTNLTGTILSKSLLVGANLEGANLTEANLDRATIANSKFDQNTKLCRLKAHKATFTGCEFKGANLSNSDFTKSNFKGSSFYNVDLRNSSLRRADLTATAWENTKIDRKTNFYLAQFIDHPVTADKSEKIIIPKSLNWKTVRWLKTIPIFQFSWISLGIFIYVLMAVKFLIVWLPFQSPNLWPIYKVIFSSLLLLSGSLVFKRYCPEEVQEFSEQMWVYAYNHPRHFYLSSTLQKTKYAYLSSLLALAGGLLLGYVIVIDVFVMLWDLMKLLAELIIANNVA